MDVDSSSLTIVWFVASLLVFALSVGAEAVLNSVRRDQIRTLLDGETPGDNVLKKMIDDPSRYRNTLAIVRLAASVSTVVAGVRIADSLSFSNGTLLIALTFVFLLIGRTIPIAFGTRLAGVMAPTVAMTIEGLALVLAPIRVVMDRVEQSVREPEPAEEQETLRLSEEELRVLANVVGEKEVMLEADEREMISRIFELGQTTVREVMVPRLDIIALDTDTSLAEALDTIVERGHSRVPVYEETIDNIVGVLYAKDILVYLRDDQPDVAIRDILRDTVFVPESKKLDEFLQDLQQSHIHIAIVVDEYGGTAGLATIEDILEEIVGEIQDEYDAEEPFIELVSETEAICDARIDLDDLNRTLDLDLPTVEYDTLGGLIYSALGRVPKVSDVVTVDGARIRVMTVNGQRIRKVRIKKEEPAPPTGDTERDEEPASEPSPARQQGEVGLSA